MPIIQPPSGLHVFSETITSNSFKIGWDTFVGSPLPIEYTIRVEKNNNINYAIFAYDTNGNYSLPTVVTFTGATATVQIKSTGTEIFIGDLFPSTEYKLSVSVSLGDGSISDYSPQVSVTTLPEPAFHAVVTTTMNAISIVWENIGASKYIVCRGVPFATGTIVVDRQTSLTFELSSGIVPDTSYIFYLLAYDSQQSLIGSTILKIRTNIPLPNIPNSNRIIAYNITASSMSLRWDASIGAELYRLYVNGQLTASAETTATNYTLTNLLPGAPYSIVLAAVNGSGEARARSITIDTASYNPNVLLNAPLLVSPNDKMTTVDPTPTLYWQVPKGTSGARYDFIVEIAEDLDFSKNVRRFNSFVSKDGFSFNSQREANSNEIVSFKIKDPLVKL